MNRRDVLRLGLAAPLLRLVGTTVRGSAERFGISAFEQAASRVVPVDPIASDAVRVVKSWHGPFCRSRAVNASARPVALRAIVLFDVLHALPAGTRFYGEGFQMLTQTGGTLGRPENLGNYTDPGHYKMPEPPGARAVYGLATFSPHPDQHHALAFTSCRRFAGKFHVSPDRLEVVVDTEGLSLGPGEEWPLEEFACFSGTDREDLLGAVARRIDDHHPRLRVAAPPSGWCSWYCFGPRVTAAQILANLDAIATSVPGLKYIQIDDGYQPAMGDWLDTGAAFGGQVQTVLRHIRDRGFEPAIWVAPFIAEEGSRLFREHPDWFVKDEEGKPLRADRVTFGGWRRGPWYAVDGTHPDAQSHLERVFRTMRRNWGCTYFKLDANFWGAMHGGRFQDPRATRVEAYRRGMEAVRRGAGDAFLLGCNHPIWASLGLIHGSRSSNDIKRDWTRITTTARQNLSRNWQNGRLWWNDPDAIVMTGDLSEEEIRFHATAIYATGGMILSGDDLSAIDPKRLEMLRKLQPPPGAAARFEDDSFRSGTVVLPDRRGVCLLNWDDAPQSIAFSLPQPFRVQETWTGEDLGVLGAGRTSMKLPARSGRLLVCRPA
ncbi:MAG TPA: glycoside hydrolase family 36 protein [Vicinamibacterales bacterium]|nr:glycoside hydrolase family 36 protein [Vicinamibacterales bacterium]